MLSFLGIQDQRDCLIKEGELELVDQDGNGIYDTIYYIAPDGKREETITTANAINIYLENECIMKG